MGATPTIPVTRLSQDPSLHTWAKPSVHQDALGMESYTISWGQCPAGFNLF